MQWNIALIIYDVISRSKILYLFVIIVIVHRLPQDPMEAIKQTIADVMKGGSAPEMLDSVLSSSNVNMSIPDTSLGDVTPLILAANYGNLPALKAVLQVCARLVNDI